jgi:hypothetical protein
MIEKAYFRKGNLTETEASSASQMTFSEVNITKDAFGGESFEYYNLSTGVNKSVELQTAFAKKATINKATIDTQTGGARTYAGTTFVPVYPDPNIVNRTIRETPLRAMTPRRAIKGLSYDYNALTAKGDPVWGNENGAIPEIDDTYVPVSVRVKYMYQKGSISGPVIAGAAGFVNPQQLDLSVKTQSMVEEEENILINGDTSTVPQEPNGLIKLITTNTTNLSGVLPTLAGIRAETATSFNNNGVVSVGVTDVSTHNHIKGLLLAIQMQPKDPKEGELGFGIEDAFRFDGVLYIRNKFMPRTASAKRILFLDMRYIFFAVLQEMTYEIKYNENDNYPYLLKEYLTIVNTFEGASTQMYGIL